MMPNALKLSETVEETAIELEMNTPHNLLRDCTWIVSVSSGTIAAGILKGLTRSEARESVVLTVHEGYSRPAEALRKYMFSYMDTDVDYDVNVIDEGYDYKQAVICQCPFPCNPYYDRKAWNWLVQNIETITTKNILFWNVGI